MSIRGNRTTNDGQNVRGHTTYWSMDEFADAVEPHLMQDAGYTGWQHPDGDTWAGVQKGDNKPVSRKEALHFSRMGWPEYEAEVFRLAAEAVTTVQAETELSSFTMTYDVCGARPDVARFLSGEPQNMMRPKLVTTPALGRVITVCASICYSASVQPQHMRERGVVLAAFVLAISKLGLGTELWIDTSMGDRDTSIYGTRVRVKSAQDVLDTSRILAAFAQPATFRRLGFADCRNWEPKAREAFGGDGCWGMNSPATELLEDLGEGTIYLGGILTGHGAPNAAEELKKLLKEAGFMD